MTDHAENIPLYSVKIIRTYDKYIQRNHPAVSLDEIHAFAGITPAELEDLSHWLTQRQVDRFHEKAADLTGDEDLALHCGQAYSTSDTMGGTRNALLSTLGPAQLYAAFPWLARQFSRAMTFEHRKLGPNKVELTFTPKPGLNPKAYQCRNTIGTLEASILLFNRTPDIQHPECYFKGGKACRYVMEWTDFPSELWFRWGNRASLAEAAVLAFAAFFLPLNTTLVLLGAWAFQLAFTQFQSYRLAARELKELLATIQNDSSQQVVQTQNAYDNAVIVNEIGLALSRQMQKIVGLGNSSEQLLHQVDAILQDTLSVLQNRLGFDRGAFYLRNPEEGAKAPLSYRVGYGFTAEQAQKALSAIAEPILRSYREHAPVLDEISAAYPLIHENEIVGVLSLDNSVSRRKTLARELNLLAGITPSVAISIRNVFLAQKAAELTQLQVEQAALKKDLEVTRAVQNLLLPKTTLIRKSRLSLGVHYEPAAQSGGDWWWFEDLPNGRERIILCDVTGHGAGSAMVTAIIASAHQSSRIALKRHLEMEELIPVLNDAIKGICFNSYWAACLVAEFDTAKNELKYGGGGIPPLLLQKKTGETVSLPVPGGSLGADQLNAEVFATCFEPGDRLLVCTDGAFEFMTDAGRPFGRKKLQQSFTASSCQEPTEGIETIMARLRAARKENEQFEDDVTLVLACRSE